MKDDIDFAKKILKTKGNCTDLDCSACPIRKSCTPGETKQTTDTRARFWLSQNDVKK